MKTWEPPMIYAHHSHGLNKFGTRRPRSEYVDQIDGVDVESLVEAYGSPLFVCSERTLRQRIRRVKQAFARHYPRVTHGWSYKTNYTSAICNIFHQEGSWAEVVSRFEYEKARSLGVPGDRILFNGPNKPRAILERAVAEGAHLHLDHFDELDLVEAIAREHGKIVGVTLRLNFDTGFTEPWSRFGFNLDSGQAQAAAKMVVRSPHLRLTGLHSHIGTFILEPRAYGEQVRRMCRFMAELEADGEVFLESLDIGGGFPSENALKGVYLPPNQAVPQVEDYVGAITSALMEGTNYREARGQVRPRLIFESGRSMVDDCESLITTVVGSKRAGDGRRAAVLDAGVNLLFTSYWYNHRVKMTRPGVGLAESTVLYGPLCMNIDVVRESVDLPPLRVGDRLLVESVGAYNNTQWMQFIEYRPAVVLIDGNSSPHVIRAAEDLSAMCAQDRLPDHLCRPFNIDEALVR